MKCWCCFSLSLYLFSWGVYLPYNVAQQNESAISKYIPGASQVALVVKNPAANAGDTRDASVIPGLGRSLEEVFLKGILVFLKYTHWSIPAWRIPQTEGLAGYGPWVAESRSHDWSDWAHTHTHRRPLPLGRRSYPLSQPSKSSQSPELSALRYTAGSHSLPIWHMVMYTHQSQFPSSSHPSLTCPMHTCLFSASLFLPCK